MSWLWRLPFPLLLALRYLRSTRKDAFVSFLSAVAAGGIGLGVAALVLALAALAGLQAALRGEVLARTPHLEIELPGEDGAAALQERLLRQPGVIAVQEAVRGRGWLTSGGLVQPVEIVGYSGLVPRFFPGAEGGAPGLYVSDTLAARWGVRRGDAMEVVSPRPTLTPLGPAPRIRSLPLAGTFKSGRTEDVERVALPVGVARPLAGNPATYLEVTAPGLEEALALVPAVQALLPADARLRTWEQLNRPLFFALRLEKSVMFVAVSLIVVVAAMALVADLGAGDHQQARRARHARHPRRDAGAAAPRLPAARCLHRRPRHGGRGRPAAGAAAVMQHSHLVHLPGQVYFLDYLPFRLLASDVAAVLAVTVVLALGSSLWVAQRVGKLQPEAMRR